MTAQRLLPAFRQIRRLLARPTAGSASDSQLLERFVRERDESALELLVWRHGPMIFGVCRRILRNEHEAEDAFQATLLVLAKKAGSISRHESLGGWLYRVAYRVALRARESVVRRARHECQAAQVPPTADPREPADLCRDDLNPVLDEELTRLAEKHRAPVVLCYLEGLTNEEAARQLRWPVGTVKTRLAQARRLLAQRLAQRGLLPASAFFAAGITPELASAVSPALVGTAVRAVACAAAGKTTAARVSAQAAILAEGVIRAMMVTKLKFAGVALMVGLTFAGAGTVSYQAFAGPPEPEEANEPPATKAKSTPASARVGRLKKQIDDLTTELKRAEQDASRERERFVPPPKGPVAIIFDDVPVTRDELADYLLARVTAKQLDAFINQRVLKHAAKKQGFTVSDKEVDNFIRVAARSNLDDKAFRAQLKSQNKTLREWKEDVIRPQLLLQKLARLAPPPEKDIRAAYEAGYGKKVECDMIIWQPSEREAAEKSAQRLLAGHVTYDELAATRPLGSRVITFASGKLTGLERLEKTILALSVGQLSPLMDLNQGWAVFRCRQVIPPNTAVRYDDVREALKGHLERRLLNTDSANLFQQLKAEARVKLLWAPPENEEK